MHTTSRAAWLATTLFALVLLAGCSLFDSDTTTAHGVVLDKESGQPIEGILVSLVDGGGAFGAYTAVATTFTDHEGRFRVASDYDNSGLFQLRVNWPAIGQQATRNMFYDVYDDRVREGQTKRFHVELEPTNQ